MDQNSPLSRARFEALLLGRRGAVAELHRLNIAITRAKAGGVERVTRDNVTTDMTMGLGLRLPDGHHLHDALRAWHRQGDKSALDLIIDFLNLEAGQ